jgi:hypothetical protein
MKSEGWERMACQESRSGIFNIFVDLSLIFTISPQKYSPKNLTAIDFFPRMKSEGWEQAAC